jgi:hypothetical protein
MLQNTIAVPPLGEPEVMSYINLLFAELYTTKPGSTDPTGGFGVGGAIG